MKTRTPFYEHVDRTLALGQSVATAIAEKRDQLGLTWEAEVLLWASISALAFAMDRYMAALAHVDKSPIALRYLGETKERCDRSLRRLQRHVGRCLRQMCRYMNDQELDRATGYVLVARA